MYDKGPVPGRNDACWCGSGKKYKKCHSAFDERLERLWEEGWEVLPRTLYKTPADIEGIKRSAAINVGALCSGDFVHIGIGEHGTALSQQGSDSGLFLFHSSVMAVAQASGEVGTDSVVCGTFNVVAVKAPGYGDRRKASTVRGASRFLRRPYR